MEKTLVLSFVKYLDEGALKDAITNLQNYLVEKHKVDLSKQPETSHEMILEAWEVAKQDFIIDMTLGKDACQVFNETAAGVELARQLDIFPLCAQYAAVVSLIGLTHKCWHDFTKTSQHN